MEALFHIFYFYWGKKDRSLYRGLRYAELCYFEVPLDTSGLLGNSNFVSLGKTVLFLSFMI